eukprot:tig00000498_g1631.t1
MDKVTATLVVQPGPMRLAERIAQFAGLGSEGSELTMKKFNANISSALRAGAEDELGTWILDSRGMNLAPISQGDFEYADADGNGKLSRHEFLLAGLSNWLIGPDGAPVELPPSLEAQLDAEGPPEPELPVEEEAAAAGPYAWALAPALAQGSDVAEECGEELGWASAHCAEEAAASAWI